MVQESLLHPILADNIPTAGTQNYVHMGIRITNLLYLEDEQSRIAVGIDYGRSGHLAKMSIVEDYILELH